jgi:hypothetical protein
LKLLTNILKNKKLYKNKEYITIILICSDILTLILFLLQNTDFIVYFNQLTNMFKKEIKHINQEKKEKIDTLKNHAKNILLFFRILYFGKFI